MLVEKMSQLVLMKRVIIEYLLLTVVSEILLECDELVCIRVETVVNAARTRCEYIFLTLRIYH